jgi:hypothetical protein
MKQVKPVEILANPTRVDQQVACPGCSARAMLFNDGSIVCVAEGTCWAPTPDDGEYFRMRRQFDADNGIQPMDRYVTLPTLLKGIQPNVPNRYDR